jgi:hypothetical protein
MKIASAFPISRQSLAGAQKDDPEIIFMIADWTSAAEKDEFEPGMTPRCSDRPQDDELEQLADAGLRGLGERYQSIKPAFGKLIHPENPSFAW